MAWDQKPTFNKKVLSSKMKKKKMRIARLRFILSTLGFTIIAIMSYILISKENPVPVKEEKRQEIVVKHTSSKKTNEKNRKRNLKKNLKKNSQKKYSELSNSEKLEYYRKKYGNNIPENLKPIVYYLENPPTERYETKRPPESIFRHHSERQIAAFLSVQPGTWMVRPVNFDDKFDSDFAVALADKIKITAEDTEDQKALKTAVIETKAELFSRLKEGEKPSQIMNEAANELYQLGQYRKSLEDEIRAVKLDPTKSDQDVIDIVDAANSMLKKKGLKPIKQPNILIRNAALTINSKRIKANQGNNNSGESK